MKLGFRTPSPKKSISNRTTGKIKRTVKHSVNPYYGKNGTGWITDPKKAAYNKVYHKTTFGVSDVIKDGKSDSSTTSNINYTNESNVKKSKRKKVQVPVGEHKTNAMDRIANIIVGILVYGGLVFINSLIFSGGFLRFLVIAEALIIIALVVFACTRKTTTDYKTVYEDKLTNDDVDKLQSVNPSYSDKVKKDYAKHLTIPQLNREVEILNNCATLMDKTSNIDTFFERYKLYMEKLSFLSDAEKYSNFNFDGDSPTKKLIENQTVNYQTQLFNEFIDRAWRKVREKAETMKTEKGKENQYIKFETLMKSHEDVLTPESIRYYKHKLETK